jgi:integrase
LISAGTWTSPADRTAAAKRKPVTFGEYAEAWLSGRKVRGRALADRTRDSYRDLLDAYILPTFATVPLKAITPEMVDHWYELCAVGRPTTQARAYSLLRTILGTAVDRNLIQTANPAKVRGGGSAERAKKVRPATLAELETLASAMPDKHRLLVLLASWCALRFGELAELRRTDIHLKRGVVRVRRGVIRTAPPTRTEPHG